jgi:broad specificity phosphatase PhoE
MERIRGSSEIPLTGEGLQKAHDLGMSLALKGGVHRIVTSNLGRTLTTARAISRYTRAPITHIGDELHPWHLGSLEGQPVTPETISMMKSAILDTPDQTNFPGRGPASTADGESFDAFKQRTLPFLDDMMREHQGNPSLKTAVVTHYRVKKLLQSWLNRGAESSYEIDPHEMTAERNQKDNQPGGIDRLAYDQNTGWSLNPVDLRNPADLMAGMYIIRHENTDWNQGKNTSQQS